MSLKELIIRRPPIAPVTLWAAVGTPARGRRWIDWTTISRTRDGALSAFLSAVDGPSWEYWSSKGWTIEPVVVAPVQQGSAKQ